MKKLITCGIAAALFAAALSTRAFAADITEDMSIFADNAEQIAAAFHDPTPDIRCLTVDPDTVMPMYSADINDFISTGKLELTRETTSGDRIYVADILDRNGEFAGVIQFKNPETEEHSLVYYSPKYTPFGEQQSRSAAFHQYSEEIRSILSANGIDTNVKEVKLAFIDGLGAVYYINTGTEEVLVPAREVKGGVVPGYFEDDMNSVVVVNEEFRAKAARIQEQDNKANGSVPENPSVPDVDNPDTGSARTSNQMTALAVGISVLSVLGAGVIAVSQKRVQR